MAPHKPSSISFADLLTGPTISILVGPERKQWILHRRLLSHSSRFFAARPQTNDDEIEYVDDSPTGWSLLVGYLYQGHLPALSEFPSPNSKYHHAVACHALYSLSLRFLMPSLANIAIDRLRHCLRSAHLVPDAQEIQDMYQTSPPGSGMRQLLIKIAARQIMDPEVERDVEAYQGCFENSPDFAVGLVREIRRATGGILLGDPNSGEGCEFHEDVAGGVCKIGGGVKRNNEMPIAQRLVPKNTSTGIQKFDHLMPSPNPEQAADISTTTRADVTTSPERRSPTPRKLDNSRKLNGSGLKVRFADRLKDQTLESAGSFSNEAKTAVGSETRNGTITSPHRQRLSLASRRAKDQTVEGAEGPPFKSPIAKREHVNRRAVSDTTRNGRVDDIVSQYNSLSVNKDTLRSREELVSKTIARRRPPKLRQTAEPLKNGE